MCSCSEEDKLFALFDTVFNAAGYVNPKAKNKVDFQVGKKLYENIYRWNTGCTEE